MRITVTPLARAIEALRTALLAVLLLAAVVVPAAAQELTPEALAMARRFVDLTDRGNVYEDVLLEMGLSTRQTVLGQYPNIVEPLTKALVAVLNSYRDKKNELMDQFARIYALRFSLEELTQIVNFYESDVGKKLSAANRGINQDMTLVLNVYKNTLSTEFYAKVRAELRAAGVEI